MLIVCEVGNNRPLYVCPGTFSAALKDKALAAQAANHGLDYANLRGLEIPDNAMPTGGGPLAVEWSGDQPVGLAAIPATPALYLVCAITDADGQDPPGVLNDGVDSFTFTAQIEDEAGNVLPVSDTWRIAVRDETGALYDQVAISMVDGVATAAYTTTRPPAKGIHLEEADLNEVPVAVPGVGEFAVKIRQNVNFKVYRSLA